MKHLIFSILSSLASMIVRIHRPRIIGVTGTSGKTTVTQHIAHFLEGCYGEGSVMYSREHYNGEYGVPLTIIGAQTAGKNPLSWIWIMLVALSRLVRRYPRYLILEYGIDHPGEMQSLLDIAVPDVAILTSIEPNHIEQFGTLDAYRREKILLVQAARDMAIVHESVRQYIDRDVVYYGLGAYCDVDASDINIHTKGTYGVVHFRGRDHALQIPALGAFQIENILPLYPLAEILGLGVNQIQDYAIVAHPEDGRSNFLTGINDTIIIDGSYNGGYMSIREGIASLRSMLHNHDVIFFLGDMRELGDMTEEIHRDLAKDILDILPHDAEVSFYLVGPSMRDYVAPALEKYFYVLTSLSSRTLGKKIATHIKTVSKESHIIYVKGSQNTIFLEEGIKEFLKDDRDSLRLVRQSSHWMKKKEEFFKSVE